MIHHIASAKAWLAASASSSYSTDSLANEGFIHLSSPEQWKATLDRYYPDRSGLVLLDVDELHPDVASSLQWEVATGGEAFPHLYARLPVSAVVAVHPLDS